MSRFATLALSSALLALAGCAGDASEGMKADREAGAPVIDGGLGGLFLSVDTQGTLHPGDRVVVSAMTGSLVETYSWTVSGPAGPVQATVADPVIGWRSVAFEVGMSGSYTFNCTAKLAYGAPPEHATGSVQVEAPNAKKRVYSVRIIPPPASDLPPTDYVFEVGGEDLVNQSWQVSPGITKTFGATLGGEGIEAYLRLLSGAGDPYPRDILLGKDPDHGTSAKVSGLFHALVLPLDTRIAPNLYTDLDPGVFPQSWVAKLEGRTRIGGTVEKEGGALPGAKVTLHQTAANGIVVPSSVGVTDTSGTFEVVAQTFPGKATLTVVPPPGAGLPIAQIDGLGTVTITKGWNLKYAATSLVSASGTITRSDGKKPAPGATVVLAMQGGPIGTLKIPGAAGELPATGRFLITLVSDKDGVLRDPETQAAVHKLPAGTYTAELWPGKAESIEQGFRSTSVVLASGTPAFQVKLAPRALLTGTVVDRAGKPVLATITATAQAGSFVASTNLSSGSYSMYVDDNTSYALIARPLESVRLGTFFQPQLKVAQAATANVALPTAVLVSGVLRTTGNTLIKDALMRVRCTSTSCANHGVIDETKSRADGSFVLRIPTVTP